MKPFCLRAAMTLVAVFGLCASAEDLGLAPLDPPQHAPSGVELARGAFVLHKFAHAIGRETYITHEAVGGRETTVDFAFSDRGTQVVLAASLALAPDGLPAVFNIKGDVARGTSIDRSLLLDGSIYHARDRQTRTDITKPDGPIFAIAGYAPVTFQMLMLQYWITHGRPAILPTLPSGSVRIHDRGPDVFNVAGHLSPLERFEVEGLVWGRETLWLDADQKLVAAITTDAEMDHFEAIREDYEGALGEFIGRASQGAAASLAQQAQAAVSGPHRDIALLGGVLIDGTGRTPIQNAAVLIHDGKIAAVGPRSSVRVPLGALRVDTRGKWMLPGLWDMHAHFEQMEWGPIYLAAGATTVRDCGNEFDYITAARDAITRHEGVGPRLLLAGLVDGTSDVTLGAVTADTPEESRTWTRRYHAAGFQQMKAYSSIKLPALKAIATEAHRLGMTVTGHIGLGYTAYEAVEAGQDQINHIGSVAEMMGDSPEEFLKAVDQGSERSRKAIAFLKAHHTVIDPTLTIYELRLASTAHPKTSMEPDAVKIAMQLQGTLMDVGPPNASSAQDEVLFQAFLRLTGALHRAGVPIVAGTDQGIPGWSLHRELELYVQAGFTPMEAIQSATVVPARAMGMQGESGTLQRGKRGDVIIVGANPLTDIHNLRRVEQVVTEGRTYQTAPLWRSVGFTP
jgi:imidazolonepropionase-like amidohydrolase